MSSCAPWLLILIATLVQGVCDRVLKDQVFSAPQAFNPADFDGGQEITLVISSYEGEPTESHISPPTLHYQDFLDHVKVRVDRSYQPHLVWSGSNLNGWERFKLGLLRRVWRPGATFSRDVQISWDAIKNVFEDEKTGKVSRARLHVLLIGEAWTGSGFAKGTPGFIFWARYPGRAAEPQVVVGDRFRSAPVQQLDQEVWTLDGLSFDYALEVHTGTGSEKRVQKEVIPHAIIIITWSGYGTTVVELARRGGKDWSFLYQGEASKKIIEARKQVPGMDQPCETGVSEIRMLDLPFPMTVHIDKDGVPTVLPHVDAVLAELQGEGGEGGPVGAVRHYFDIPPRPQSPITRRDILEGMLSWAAGDMRTVDGSLWNNNNCQIFFLDFFRHFIGANVSRSFYRADIAYRSGMAVRNSFPAQEEPAQSDELAYKRAAIDAAAITWTGF